MNKLNKFDKIPNEIKINMIEPFTRKPQDNALCYDIRCFIITFKYIYSYFYQRMMKFIFSNVDNSTVEFVPRGYILKTSWIFLEIELVEYLMINRMLLTVLRRPKYGKRQSTFKYFRILNMSDNNIDFTRRVVFYKKSKRNVKHLWSIMNPLERFDFINIKMNRGDFL
jgi:hypothetical protein